MKTRIKYFRIRAGMSQAELARRAGVSQQAISAYEGTIFNPRLDVLAKIGKALAVRLDELVREA